MENEYKVQNYLDFIKNGRFDKISRVGILLIFDEVERLRLIEKQSIENKKSFKEVKVKHLPYANDIEKFINDFKVNIISIAGTASDGFVLYYND